MKTYAHLDIDDLRNELWDKVYEVDKHDKQDAEKINMLEDQIAGLEKTIRLPKLE